MAQNVVIAGATYSNVPAVNIPKSGGGNASFVDTTDANAVAADISNGKTAYVNGVKVTGTGSGGGNVGTATVIPSKNASFVEFTINGQPTWFTVFVVSLSSGAKNVVTVIYNGTNYYGNSINGMSISAMSSDAMSHIYNSMDNTIMVSISGTTTFKASTTYRIVYGY